MSAIEAKDGDSALHWAVYKGQQEIVHMLLEVRTSKACDASVILICFARTGWCGGERSQHSSRTHSTRCCSGARAGRAQK